MFGLIVGWCCSWARLAEGLVGILSLGKFTPHWGLAICEFFNRRRVRKLQEKELPVGVETQITAQLECPKCGGKEFQLGPRGGAAQNIRCQCGYEFNVISLLVDGRFFVEDITKYSRS